MFILPGVNHSLTTEYQIFNYIRIKAYTVKMPYYQTWQLTQTHSSALNCSGSALLSWQHRVKSLCRNQTVSQCVDTELTLKDATGKIKIKTLLLFPNFSESVLPKTPVSPITTSLAANSIYYRQIKRDWKHTQLSWNAGVGSLPSVFDIITGSF